MSIHWEWKTFDSFTNPQILYQVLKLRSEIFVVEQNCVYLDPDGQDFHALHLLGWLNQSEPKLIGYARLFLPSEKNKPIVFGRVAIDSSQRGKGWGDQLVATILNYIKTTEFKHNLIEISAQHYLVKFYRKFGFQMVGEPYDEDGIRHIKMQLETNREPHGHIAQNVLGKD